MSLRITLLAAITADGFLTKGNDPYPQTWTSTEDKNLLTKMASEFPLHVMGKKTYDVHKPKPHNNHIVVLTKEIDQYKSHKAQSIEFRNLNVARFIKEYSDYKRCLLLGGAFTYQQFLEAKAVSEAYITIEPVIVGTGVPFPIVDLERSGLTLESKKLLNNTGTRLEHYVLKK